MSLTTDPAGPAMDKRVDWRSVRAWVSESLGRGWTLEQIVPLEGATSSTILAISASHGVAQAELVLRLYTKRSWLIEVPDVPAREAANLALAGQVAGLRVPEVINVDAWGGGCRLSDGTPLPALLMTRLPGQVWLPQDPDQAWLRGLAEAIAPLHAHDGATLWRCYAPYVDLQALTPPDWSAHPDLWAAVIERVQGPWPAFHPCLIHRDYHPNNVLWLDGAVSGIIDWPLACRGPAQIDAAWCRSNLISLYGLETTLAYTDAWQAVEGSADVYEPFWDLLVLVEHLEGQPEAYSPWRSAGGPVITARQMVHRLDAWLVWLSERL